MDDHELDEHLDTQPNHDFEAKNHRNRSRTVWIAWLVILATIAFLVIPRNVVDHGEPDESTLVMHELQAKYLLGARSFGIVPGENLREQVESAFYSGSLRQQLIGPVLIGEFAGAKDGLKALDQLRDRDAELIEQSAKPDQQVIELLEKVLVARTEQQDLTSVIPDDEQPTAKALLTERLGWAGSLALLPPETPDHDDRARLVGQARSTFLSILIIFGCGAMAFVVGTVLQVAWWGFAISGRLSRGIAALRGNQAIYAETFAVWIAMYVAISFIITKLPLERLGMTAVLIPMIGGLSALAWPVFRGIPWRDVRSDLGLYWDSPAWATPFIGLGSYLAALPLIGCAMVVTLILMKLSSMLSAPGGSTPTPIHPIVEPILRGDWMMRLQLMCVAVFAAVPEEIMFRGVLYRHLRDSGSRPGSVGRMIFAMLVSSLIFAAIHPQGLFGIPILMTVALVLAAIREWRGSLVPCMIAHGMVNAVTTVVLFLIAD